MAKMNKKKVAGEVAAGLAAAGVAAAGYYFYASKKAKTHRRVAAKWASDMKKDVIRKTKSLKNITAKDFAKVVDTIARTYREVDAGDLRRAASELKSNWEQVQREVKGANRKTATRTKSATTKSKKTTKKTSTKRKAR